ncbi:uncharacterized protein LOC136087957 [Hydra vulgaris]|uniref:Uncharacterized protein LOC136087957 n=1 Tax=Hydra vulgaris TaxID=6087 RepID=A0ABM4D090_HYDVU
MDSNQLNFESTSFNFFQINDFLLDNESDPDINYFSEASALQNCSYFYNNELKDYLNRDFLNVIHFNIRSLKKNFDTFHSNIEETSNIFNIICITETWCSSDDVKNSNLLLPGFNLISLGRKNNKQGGGILFYVNEYLRFINRPDLSISDGDKEVLSIEILTKNAKNIILSCCYCPPNGVIEDFNAFLHNDIIKKSSHEKKLNYIIGDFNLNCFEYHTNTNIKKFYNDIFEIGAIPLINKPTRISSTSASILDNIITTDVFNLSLKKEKYKDNSKQTWQVLREITGSKKLKASSLPKAIKIDNKIFDDPGVVANKMNEFFTSVKPNLAKKNSNINKTINRCSFPLISYLNSFELSFDEFDTAFKMLKLNRAVGPDDINGNIAIDSCDIIKNILFKIFKCSIQQGIFPDELKIARVSPIFKGGDLLNVNINPHYLS